MFAPRNSRPSEFRRKILHKLESDHVKGKPKKAPLKLLNRDWSTVGCQKTTERLAMTSLEHTISVFETTTMAEAFRSYNVKKDYILVLGKSNNLVGIITSTDIVYRIIAYGLDPHSTIAGQIMTRNPVVVRDSISPNHALSLMVSHKIKHLPICDKNGTVVRLLCLKDVFSEYLENSCHILDASETLYNTVVSAKATFGTNESLAQMLASAAKLVEQSSMPDFGAIVADQGQPIFVGPLYTVRRTAQLMKYRNASAVCIVGRDVPNHNGSRSSPPILGLCALKDIAFHFIDFGTNGSKIGVSRIMKKDFLRVRSSANFQHIAKRMVGGFFSDALVETMEGVPSIVSMFTMSTAIVYQGDQHPRRPIKTTFYHNSKNAEAKRTTSIAQDTRSLSTKDDSSLPHLKRTDNVCTVPTVAVADTGVTISHASDTAKSNVHCTHEAPPEYTPSVNPQMEIEDVQHSLLAYPLRGHQALLDLKAHYDVFCGYLPLKDRPGVHLNRSSTQRKIVALSSFQLFELSTDVYNEVLRRQKAWRDEYTTPFLPPRAGFSPVRNQARQKLSSFLASDFQNFVQEVYIELYQRYPPLREDCQTAHAIIVAIARLNDILEDVSQYRRLLGVRTRKAKRLLDFFQSILDMPGLLPELWRNFSVAMQRLSQCSGLYPTCYDLKEIELIGNHPITSGGFADIYKGCRDGQMVCLKVMRLYQTSHLELIFKRISSEAILWGQLQHPNILPFYGIYYMNNRPCLVSPWLGQDVNCFLSDNPEANRRLLVSDVASGVKFLHSRDVIHGDLKGANILVNKYKRAIIADFGLSAVSDSNILHWASHSSVASKGGSVRWQAPELFDNVNDEVIHNTKASDVYALSCAAYEIFTEKLPFFELGKLEPTIMLNVKAGVRPSRPTDLSPAWWPMRLTRSFWRLMESCWDPSPKQRPSIDVICSHEDLKMLNKDGRNVDTILSSDFRPLVSSRWKPPSFQAIQEILRDLENFRRER